MDEHQGFRSIYGMRAERQAWYSTSHDLHIGGGSRIIERGTRAGCRFGRERNLSLGWSCQTTQSIIPMMCSTAG